MTGAIPPLDPPINGSASDVPNLHAAGSGSPTQSHNAEPDDAGGGHRPALPKDPTRLATSSSYEREIEAMAQAVIAFGETEEAQQMLGLLRELPHATRLSIVEAFASSDSETDRKAFLIARTTVLDIGEEIDLWNTLKRYRRQFNSRPQARAYANEYTDRNGAKSENRSALRWL